jgi:transposase
VCIRRQRSRATVKELHRRLQHASQRDAVRVVRRPTVWLALLVHHVPVEVRRARWSRSTAWLSQGRQALLRRGLDRVVSHQSGGRRPPVTPRQNKRVVALLEAGPQGVGGEPAWWTAVRIRVLRWRECGVLSNGQYVWTVRHNCGVALHKARLVADHRDAARRHAWLQEAWPRILPAATRRQGLILLEEEASCAQWGSCSDTWARRGQPPEVNTRGNRKG